MAQQPEQGTLDEAFVTGVLSARRLEGARASPDGEESYMVAFGDEQHPAWMRVWPQGGGITIESDWGLLRVEGITNVSTRRGRLWLESPREGEQLVVEVSPNGMWQARRGVPGSEADLKAGLELGRGAQEPAAANEAERVELHGFVGAAVTFRTTPKEKKLVATFPLGVHPDAETTEWVSVVAFGQWAKRLQDKPLVVGQKVEVVGFVHPRERRTRTGQTRIDKQVYAVAVRTTLRNRPE